VSELANKLKEDLESLRKLRDELRVKANLGTKEIRDLWQETETKWRDLESKRQEIGKATTEAARDVSVALGNLAKSLRDAYTHIRSKL